MKFAEKIGVDVGGSKIAVIVLSGSGAVKFESRVSTPKNDYDGVLQRIAHLVAEARDKCSGEPTIGIGIPGSISPQSSVIQNANSTWMNARDFESDISNVLGKKVKIANDANCLALSESFDGAAIGAKTVFGVIIGTGCGGGLVVNNQIVVGRHAIAGEWGHTPLPWQQEAEFPGPKCWCGRSGCLELWVSGSGIERDCHSTTGETLMVTEIMHHADLGDKKFSQLLDNHCDRLARGLAMISNIVDPDVIVLGGGLSNMKHLYERLPDLMSPYIFADHFRANIKPPVHGDASGVRGAARLWD